MMRGYGEDESRISNCREQHEANSCCFLGIGISWLVRSSIPSCLRADIRESAAPRMALATAVLTLAELLVICLGFAAVGNMLLRFLRLEMDRDAEHLLCAVAAGLVTSEVLLFLVQLTQRMRSGCFGIVMLLCVLLILEWKRVWNRLQRVPG